MNTRYFSSVFSLLCCTYRNKSGSKHIGRLHLYHMCGVVFLPDEPRVLTSMPDVRWTNEKPKYVVHLQKELYSLGICVL